VYKELHKGKGKIVRRRSVDNVIEELRSLKIQKRYKFIRFLDDLFTLSPDWVEEFSFKYKREIGLPFSCLVRADHITPKIARDLKEAGCWRVQMGIETADDHTRRKILKRNMSNEEILQAARVIKDEGIKLVTGNIVGIPGSSLAEDFRTLELNIKIKPAYAGVSLLQPYPGTEIHKYAQDLGMLDSSFDFGERSFRKVSVLKFKNERIRSLTENFQKLFPIAVEFPWLLPIVKVLITLPRNQAFNLIFSRWVNYNQYFRIIPPHLGWMNIWKRSKIYYRMYLLYRKLAKFFKRTGAPETR
jgi:radical SAM superfamily enzyme YgiQ (UPF0313 family)